MTYNELKAKISKQEVDTVLVCMVDMQGRLMGKRFHAEAFLEIAESETHCCNYLLATDLEMATQMVMHQQAGQLDTVTTLCNLI